jgi:hypothetical protein
MMKYPPVLLSLMKSKNLFLLHNKVKKRLVHFLLQDANDTYSVIQKSEEEMEALDEVDGPCCTIKDEEAVHEDEEMTHAENIKSSKYLHKKKQ